MYLEPDESKKSKTNKFLQFYFRYAAGAGPGAASDVGEREREVVVVEFGRLSSWLDMDTFARVHGWVILESWRIKLTVILSSFCPL